MSNTQMKLILFDLGGVLVELGEELFPSSWIPNETKFGLKEWFSSEAAINFETGLISPKEFISELKETLSIRADDHQIHAAFEAWPKGLLPSTDELLKRLKVDYRVAVLSNSNEIHEPILMRDFGLEHLLEDIFFSHLIGYSKPNHEAFNYVLAALDVEPNDVMFFDDNAGNVVAAQELGMQAFQVTSPAQVAKYI